VEWRLVVAEGGTEYEHAVTVARSELLEGSYEVHPDNPVLTSKRDPTLALQKAGHASFIEMQTGEWYLAHPCGRSLEPPGASDRHCNPGGETAIQRLVWGVDGWPRLAHGENTPAVNVPAPDLPDYVFERDSPRDDFDCPELSNNFQSLRTPVNQSWLSLTARPGYLPKVVRSRVAELEASAEPHRAQVTVLPSNSGDLCRIRTRVVSTNGWAGLHL
jgi:xylan 1,4-beta-xylosidase